MMEFAEPGELAKVGALAGHLEVKELQGIVFLWSGGEGELVGFVVFGNEVFDDGTGFPESDASVRVMNGGGAENFLAGKRYSQETENKRIWMVLGRCKLTGRWGYVSQRLVCA